MSKRPNPDDYAPIVADHVRDAIDRTPWGTVYCGGQPMQQLPSPHKDSSQGGILRCVPYSASNAGSGGVAAPSTSQLPQR